MRLLSSVFVAVALFASPAFSQTCDFNVCPSGYTYDHSGTDASGVSYGVCNYCDWWGFCDHQLVYCPSGSTLNANGQCEWNLCGGSACGGSLALCDSGETYTGSGVDASGNVYGVCQTGPSYLGGPIAHELKYCRSGWVLQTGTGQCFKPCLPDLTIAATYLRDSTGAWVGSIHYGQKYRICSVVKNIGTAWAGPSWVVSSGALGVSVAPTVTKGWLAPGAFVEACLDFWTTPPVGTWHVGVGADSTHVIGELLETNNGSTATVTIVP